MTTPNLPESPEGVALKQGLHGHWYCGRLDHPEDWPEKIGHGFTPAHAFDDWKAKQ